MAFDWGETKAEMQQAVHDTMQRACTVMVTPSSDAVTLTCRWHSKIGLFGDMDSQGYAQFVDTIDRLIFNRPELTAKGIVLDDRSVVSFDFSPQKLRLDVKQPYDGRVEEVWTVVRGG